jgi:hypothetical protein
VGRASTRSRFTLQIPAAYSNNPEISATSCRHGTVRHAVFADYAFAQKLTIG